MHVYIINNCNSSTEYMDTYLWVILHKYSVFVIIWTFSNTSIISIHHTPLTFLKLANSAKQVKPILQSTAKKKVLSSYGQIRFSNATFGHRPWKIGCYLWGLWGQNKYCSQNVHSSSMKKIKPIEIEEQRVSADTDPCQITHFPFYDL